MINSRLTKHICRVLISFGLFAMSLTLPAEETPVVGFEVTNFVVEGENPISEEETTRVLEVFLGSHDGLTGLLEAASELESAILQSGHSFIRVVLPPQTLESGVVKLKVIKIKLAKIEVEDNKYFSDENIIQSLPSLKVGMVPDTKELARQLIVANKHPSKLIKMRMKKSEEPESIDAILNVKDQRPWQVFSSLNNIGTPATGRLRLTLGGQHNNILGYDDSFTASYTTSPGRTSDVKQWGLNYRIPVYKYSGSFSFFYSRSDVDSGTIQSVLDVSGAGKFVGGSYTQTFYNRKNYRHRMSIGVDDKIFINSVISGSSQLGVNVRSRPMTFTYSGELQMEKSQARFNLSYVRNLNGGNLNSKASYAASRTNSEQDWDVIRYNANYNRSLNKNWLLKLSWQGQWSNEALISGEQFGLGGINSVRGFEERAVSGDRGNQATLEFDRTFHKNKGQFRIFTDMGHVKVISPTSGTIVSQTLISSGIGMTYRWKDALNFSIDYGHELNNGRSTDIGGTKTHASIFYRF